MEDMAEELLKLYAQRKAALGTAFSPDTAMLREFEDAFDFNETEDQLNAVKDIKADMESTQPMDRLLCGDVGYGKTEVAMRAAFKAVQGWQTGRGADTNNHPLLPAFRKLQEALRKLPGHRRNDFALPHGEGKERTSSNAPRRARSTFSSGRTRSWRKAFAFKTLGCWL